MARTASAARRRRNSYGSTGVQSVYYSYDNTARRLVPEEQIEERRRQREAAKRNQKNIRRERLRQRQALRMDLPYLMMLTAATIAALVICCSYISVQSDISSTMRTIEQQEQELEKLKSENDALQTSINTNIDLDHIYDVATNELGMVYANRSQVIHYKKTESEYVRQYEDIPGASEN